MKRLFLSLLFLFAASPAAAREPDIADFLSAPFVDVPVAAEAAPVIAWSANERGARNVWTARAPDFAPRQLTRFEGDDGQPVSALRLSADGRWLAFVRGANGVGGAPVNPAGDPDGATRSVWLVATDGSAAPREAGAGTAPLFSPRGDVLVMLGAKGPSCVPVIADAKAPDWCRETLLSLPGSNSAVAFSPDGTRLLIASDRGDHAFVGVMDLATRRVRWLAPDFARDSSPVWSPDGRQVAFVRRAGQRSGEVLRLDATWPFELWVADAASGEGRRLFRSGPHAGWLGGAAVLDWTDDGRIVFASEDGGWSRWYALPATGGDPQPLSRGECEADAAAVIGAGDVVYAANCADIERRQLFLAAAQGGAPTRLTATTDIATDPVAAGDDWIVFRHADARLPTGIAVLPKAGGQARRIFPAKLPASFPLDRLVQPETLTLTARDGFVSHAQLFEPAAPANGRRAAIIYVHGGPIRQMLPGWMPMEYYWHDYANNQWLASQGYVVLSLNFRAGTGYGQAFRNAEKQGPRGASEYQDVLAAHAYLAAREDVDPERIGIYGGSYGGYLTALALARDSELFAAGVDRHGVHDWRESAKGGDNSAFWGLQPDELELAGKSSPVASLDTWRSPVLIVHGDGDTAVKFAQGTDLAVRLRERGVPVETLVLPGEEHFFLRHDAWLQVYRRSSEFFSRTLAP